MAHTQQHPRHLEPRPRLPVPDLRLETTFLRSISPYVHDGGARVQWAMVAWVAVRDSMLSPMMWGTAATLVRPLWAAMWAGFRGADAAAGSRPHAASEGRGASWLREWLGGLLGQHTNGVGAPALAR